MRATMGWWTLIVAGLAESAFALSLRYSAGMTRLWPSIVTILSLVGSMWFLGRTFRFLPMGTAYAIWTGIGMVTTLALGILLFDEPRSTSRFLCLCLIVIGIVGLNLSEAH